MVKQGLGSSKAWGRVSQKEVKVEKTGTFREAFNFSKGGLKETAGAV